MGLIESNLGALEKEVGNNAIYETKFRVNKPFELALTII